METSIDLLGDEWLCWSNENNLRIARPSIPVQHDGGCDKGFAETGGESDEEVMKEATSNDVELIIADLADVCWINPCSHSIWIELVMRRWFSLAD